MNPLSHRAFARHFGTAALVIALAAIHPVRAEDPDPAALSLEDAAQLAIGAQPLLDAQRQAIRSARESAIAAGQLPDPMLVGGITDLTVTGADRYTLRNESDTQFMLGVRQTFPGGDKRELRSARSNAQSARLEAELQDQTRMVRREAALAWLEVWKATQAQSIVKASIREAERQIEVTDIAYRSGRAMQADLLTARVSLELLNDQLAGYQQREWHARNQLRRWIGADAERTVCPDLPEWSAPDLPSLLANLEHHPHLAVQARAAAVARAELGLAKADYSPDWSLQAGYGYRPEFEDYASLQFEVGLPFFTRNRQDRLSAARSADVEQAEDLRSDLLRQHVASIQLNTADWQRLQDRLARYDTVIQPQAQQRLETVLAAYGAGSGQLLPVLDARRSLLEIRMQRLELQFDAAMHQVQLQYFAYEGPQS
ncbi:MAG: TolC family protein [Burkholderiales bacterium]